MVVTVIRYIEAFIIAVLLILLTSPRLLSLLTTGQISS